MANVSTHLREYETIYVLKPELDEETAQSVMMAMKELVNTNGGKSIKVTNWGRRKLAWERAKHQRGVYVHHNYLGGTDLVAEYERKLGIDEKVLLRQTILVNRSVDADSREEQADELTAPVQERRRDNRDRRRR